VGAPVTEQATVNFPQGLMMAVSESLDAAGVLVTRQATVNLPLGL